MPRSERPLLGLIVPPADGAVPPELPTLYGDALDFAAVGLAVPALSEAGFDTVLDAVARAGAQLASRGARGVAVMGTSLSFYRGAAFNARLRDALASATGLPTTTMSDAIVEALRSVGGRRLAVATAYDDALNERLRAFLAHEGFEVASLEALRLTTVAQVHAVTQADLAALCERAAAATGGRHDALLVSCGGLRTLELTAPLEARLGVPVVSSAVAGAWRAARLVGHDGRAPGFGRLLEQEAPPTAAAPATAPAPMAS